MKKIIFLFGLLLSVAFSPPAEAQTKTPASGALTITGATLTNADTAYAYGEINGDGTVTISAAVTYVSGTLAGDARLFVSTDGTNYALYSNTDTLAIASPITFNGVVSCTKHWAIADNYYRYYIVRARTTGTSVGTLSGSYKFTRRSGY